MTLGFSLLIIISIFFIISSKGYLSNLLSSRFKKKFFLKPSNLKTFKALFFNLSILLLSNFFLDVIPVENMQMEAS